MGTSVIAVYKPHAGKARELEELVVNHVPILRSEGLATERQPIVMRASDGSLVEVFEWVSARAIENAHSNGTVQELWLNLKRFVPTNTPTRCPNSGNCSRHSNR